MKFQISAECICKLGLNETIKTETAAGNTRNFYLPYLLETFLRKKYSSHIEHLCTYIDKVCLTLIKGRTMEDIPK